MRCLSTAAARAWAARATLLLALPACAGAQAAPVPAVAPALPAAASVRIVQRLARGSDAGLPDLTGLRLTEATRDLHAAQLRLQAVALRPGARTVTSQWPEPGQRPSEDGTVVVWLGRPPSAPGPAAPAPAGSLPAPQPAAGATPAPSVVSLAPGAPPPAPAGGTATTATAATPPPGGEPTGDLYTGLASWYGPGFDGRTTACGNRFDEDAYTLASRDLDCGTTVRVTGPGGRSVTAVVDDWGPAAWTGRRFDLSKATFAAVHRLSAGVATITVEVLR